MLLNKYIDFINESQIQLLFEANIVFDKKFIDLINLIQGNDLKDKLLSLQGKEIDINTNHITFDLDKEDKIFFIPEDRIKRAPAKVKNPGDIYSGMFEKAKEEGTYQLGKEGYPIVNQEVKVKNLNQEEIDKIYGRKMSLIPFCHISWIENENKLENFIAHKGIEYDINKLTKSDMNIGRFVRAILRKADIEFTDKQIEDFVNKYKATIQKEKNVFSRFDIVKGEDIRYWYLEDNYYKIAGTLGSSCMRYKNCQPYLDIYVKNIEICKLIILKAKEDETKIIGRALLWTDTQDRKIMDRIYVINSADETLFKEFAIEKGFHYKKYQSYSDQTLMFNQNELDKNESSSTIELNWNNMRYYPYMDSFKYYNKSGYLYNDSDKSYDYELTDTNGGNGTCDECGGSGEVQCSECNGGSIECYRCDGAGEIECSRCDGEGLTECESCVGDGEIECTKCEGDGEIDGIACDLCDESGRINCGDCSGSGKEECSRCDGDGSTECSRCDGDGSSECDECGGSGTINCYECS
jgi:hypothetical protein